MSVSVGQSIQINNGIDILKLLEQYKSKSQVEKQELYTKIKEHYSKENYLYDVKDIQLPNYNLS